jgi:hypothetical protein
MDTSNNSENQEELSRRNYIKWGDPNVEKIPEGEAEDIQAVVEQINAIQEAQYNCHRHCYSGMDEKLVSRCRVTDIAGIHARTQSIVKGTLVVEKNLPTHLRQSMFAEEREWPVLCRYSSEPGDLGLDVSIDVLQLHSHH